jgi:hypothetical protein
MPPKSRRSARRQRSPSAPESLNSTDPAIALTSSPATYPAKSPEKSQREPSMKDIQQLIPLFVAPARIWVQKVKLLTESISGDNRELLNVVHSRLPDPLFSQITAGTHQNLQQLLARIEQLEQGPSSLLALDLFGTKSSLKPGQKPSALFVELLALVKQVMPQSSTEQLTAIAKLKLMTALPPTAQALVELASKDSSFELILSSLDNLTLSEVRNVNALEANVQGNMETPPKGVLEQVLDRLNSLEDRFVSVNHVSSKSPLPEVCWYHSKYGKDAFNCKPPCRYHKSQSKNC